MAIGSPATTRPTEQTAATPIPGGGVMQECRQWLAPGVVVTVVFAMGALQRADIRELSSKVDQVNGRIDRIYELLLP